MKKTLLSMLAVALLLGSARQSLAQADDMKPIVVVSISSYQRIMDDLAFVGKLADSPDLAENLEGMITFFTQGQGLAGLDKTRPWGLAASTDGLSFQILGFLPVTDTKKLLDALSGFLGDAEKQGDVWRLQAPVMPIPLYIKEKDGYAFISQDTTSLQNLPKDPVKLLGGLDKEYDVAARLNIQNIPEVFRQLAIDQIRLGVEGSLEQGPDETDEAFEARSRMTQAQMDSLVTTLNELEDITLGLAIDQTGRRTYIDLAITAVEGSKSAKQMSGDPAPPSKYAGFLMEDAVATLHVNSKSTPEDAQQMLSMVQQGRSQIEAELDKEENIRNEQVRKALKEIVGQVMDVVEDTVKQGTFNGGAVVVGDGPFTLAAGGFVADGKQLEGVVKKLVELVENEPDFPKDGLKLNADKHGDIVFHTLEIDIPDEPDAEMAKQLIGDKARIAVAFGPQSAFFAVGDKGVETIKQVIDKSKTAANPANSLDLTVRLAPILKLIAESEDADPIMASIAAALRESGKDRVQLSAQSIKNGTRIRLEAEEGVLKVIGAGAKLAAQQAGVGAF